MRVSDSAWGCFPSCFYLCSFRSSRSFFALESPDCLSSITTCDGNRYENQSKACMFLLMQSFDTTRVCPSSMNVSYRKPACRFLRDQDSHGDFNFLLWWNDNQNSSDPPKGTDENDHCRVRHCVVRAFVTLIRIFKPLEVLLLFLSLEEQWPQGWRTKSIASQAHGVLSWLITTSLLNRYWSYQDLSGRHGVWSIWDPTRGLA